MYELLKFILIHIDINSTANYDSIRGYPALHMAIINNDNSDVIRLLIDMGANVNQLNDISETALHLAVCYEWLDVVYMLLDNDIDINIQDKKGNTALHKITKEHAYGNLDVAQVIIENDDSNLDIEDNDGCAPLQYAVNRNNFEIAEMLLEHGADVDTIDHDDRTCLHIASANCDINCVILLLKYGANVEVWDTNDNSPLDLSSKGYDHERDSETRKIYHEIMELLREKR